MSVEESCGVVVFRNTPEGRLYLIVYDLRNEKWGIPKGHKEPGETNLQTAQREVLEETGLKPKIISDHTISLTFVNSKNIHRLITFFIGEVHDDIIMMQDTEISEYEWLYFSHAVERVHKRFKPVLQEAEDYLNNHSKVKIKN